MPTTSVSSPAARSGSDAVLVVLLLLQAAVATQPERIDLLRRPPACPPESGDDVVVCARRQDAPRITRVEERPARPLSDALTFRLPGGGTGNVHAIQTYLPGASGSGAAVTLRIPLGKRAKE